MRTVNVLGISGSLRKNSYNTGLLRAAQQLLPEGMTLEVFDIAGIPLFNQDDEFNPPEIVQEFKTQIVMADALLIATPEYNYSIPGVLKNAIDWASRPPQASPFKGKPLGLMGATVGQMGTVRAQLALRQIAAYLDMYPVNKPEVLVTRAKEKFNVDGKLTDETTRKFISELLFALQEWTLRLRGERKPESYLAV